MVLFWDAGGGGCGERKGLGSWDGEETSLSGSETKIPSAGETQGLEGRQAETKPETGVAKTKGA